MIRSVEFENFRNLDGRKFVFSGGLSAIIGKNSSGKTNLLDGIRLAFSAIAGDYVRFLKSDFTGSDDSKALKIKVELDGETLPSCVFYEENGDQKCGFILVVTKAPNGRYNRKIVLLNNSQVDLEILLADPKIPNLRTIPLARIEEVNMDGVVTNMSKFIQSEDSYQEILRESKGKIREEARAKIEEFTSLCGKFGQSLDISIADPKLSNEKAYVVDSNSAGEHSSKIGAGYKSIANIILNTLDEGFNIILIDEIENHLHPPLLRTLIRELRGMGGVQLIVTTHSSTAINEFTMEEIIDVSGIKIIDLDDADLKKLKTFLHPGRNELILADNVVLVEGYSEELIFNNYVRNHNLNWTIVNVAGVMFGPYIELAHLLGKKIIVISDNDKSQSPNQDAPTSRFTNLCTLCADRNATLIEVENTLESDLYDAGCIPDSAAKLLCTKGNFHVARNSRAKMMIAHVLIEKEVNLGNWHVIQELEEKISELNGKSQQ